MSNIRAYGKLWISWLQLQWNPEIRVFSKNGYFTVCECFSVAVDTPQKLQTIRNWGIFCAFQQSCFSSLTCYHGTVPKLLFDGIFGDGYFPTPFWGWNSTFGCVPIFSGLHFLYFLEPRALQKKPMRCDEDEVWSVKCADYDSSMWYWKF